MRGKVGWIVGGLTLCILFIGWQLSQRTPLPDIERPLFEGIRYIRQVRKVPRPVVLQILLIDLRTPGISFEFTDGAKGRYPFAAQRTTEFLQKTSCQVAVNASFFFPFWSHHPMDYYPHVGDRVRPLGSYISHGREFGKPETRFPTLYFDQSGLPTFSAPSKPRATISGNLNLLKDGKFYGVGNLGPDQTDVQPRTALGLSKDKNTLILLVADGRQPGYSEGLLLPELAQILKSFGAEDALNLDGGGSEAMAAQDSQGKAYLLSDPIDLYLPGRERIVATHLGIRANPIHKKPNP